MKILSFDVESNGLQGDAFAVAGLLIDENRNILTQLVVRTAILGPVDPWVSANVLGPMSSILESAPNAKTMRDEFWAWYLLAKAQADIIVAANPYPVEARFLIDCQNDDVLARGSDHPFPFYDLSSMLYTLGYTTPATRREFVAEAVGQASGDPHNPLWDAQATALAALQAIKSLSVSPQPTVSQ
jgi:hypothetical protein